MKAIAEKWLAVPDIGEPFGSLSFAKRDDELTVTMHGSRDLTLCFGGVLAVRFENECPGFEPLPTPLPMLNTTQTFPLLIIKASSWIKQVELAHPGCAHFALVSSDDLLQVIAKAEVEARWQT